MSRVEYRIVREEDFEEMGDLVWDFYKKTSKAGPRDSYLRSRFVLLALVSDKPVGALRVISDGWRGFLVDLLVTEDFRGIGIGGTLVRMAVEEARLQGLKRLTLITSPKSLSLSSYYAKYGFKVLKGTAMGVKL